MFRVSSNWWGILPTCRINSQVHVSTPHIPFRFIVVHNNRGFSRRSETHTTYDYSGCLAELGNLLVLRKDAKDVPLLVFWNLGEEQEGMENNLWHNMCEDRQISIGRRSAPGTCRHWAPQQSRLWAEASFRVLESWYILFWTSTMKKRPRGTNL